MKKIFLRTETSDKMILTSIEPKIIMKLIENACDFELAIVTQKHAREI